MNIKEYWDDFPNSPYPKDRRMKDSLEGMNRENIRFCINEMVRLYAQDSLYLEVGTLHGSSLIAAAMYNESTTCIGLDNFSLFNRSGENEKKLIANLSRFNVPNASYVNIDYKKYLTTKRVSVYYYDGNHSFENQRDGLLWIRPFLTDKCCILVDDTNCESVQKAIEAAELSDFETILDVKTGYKCDAKWWNGFQILVRN